MSFKVGDKVVFGRPNGEKTIGTVVKINPRRVKVRQDEARGSNPTGTVWSMSPALITLADTTTPIVTRRDAATILGEAAGIVAALSPENLHCDGERSLSSAKQEAARLRRRFKELEIELGRQIDDFDGRPWGATSPQNKPVGFRPGDSVAFDARGKTMTGTVVRVNQKTVAVVVRGSNSYWRVPPTMLRAV